jgi:hypothetical protein
MLEIKSALPTDRETLFISRAAPDVEYFITVFGDEA